MAVGAIEAKPEVTTLSGVEEQTGGYLFGLPEEIPHASNPLPFGYESTGTETFFVDLRDQNPRSRRVFAFHKPQTLKDWMNQGETLRVRLKELPALAAGYLLASPTGGRSREKKSPTGSSLRFRMRPVAAIQS